MWEKIHAFGVSIEAFSVEYNGDGICFKGYTYNVQHGILMEHKTGNSERDLTYTGANYYGWAYTL